MGRLDRLISRIGELTSSVPRTHAGVTFDPRNGLGAVHDAANADYRGFTAYMPPKRFLQINPPRDIAAQPIDHILEAIDAGRPLGPPIVYVDRTPDKDWQVVGHEGRGRMTALQQRHPDALFPVAVHPLGVLRASHLKDEDAFAWLRPDKGGHLPARGNAVILRNQLRVSPSDSEFFQRHGMHPALEDLIRELAQ